MDVDTFIRRVADVAGVSQEQAHRAIVATLQTLAERITAGQARDVAQFLPRPVGRWLTSTPEPAEAFDVDEFVRRVAEREGVDETTAREHARAVFAVLGATVAPKELRDMVSQLPIDFDPLLEAAGIGRAQVMRAHQP